MRVLVLLLGLLLSLPASAAEISIELPGDVERVDLETEEGARYLLDDVFEQLITAQPDRLDLWLYFSNGGEVVLHDWWSGRPRNETTERAKLSVAGSELTSASVLFVEDEVAAASVETAAGSGGSRNGDGPRDAGEGFQTARRLLFPDEKPGSEFGFHSYLLFDKADSSGMAFERRKAAVEAYFAEVSSLASMLDLEIPESEINVFWLPLTVPEDARSAEEIHALSDSNRAAELVSLALSQYDFARARALLRQLDLAGGGPWIVSHPTPLSATARPATPDRLLVQDLSRAPPRLVRSWVQHFKRRLEDEPAGVASRLRGFVLALRTEVANLAEGLAITREAVVMTLGDAAVPAVAAAEVTAEVSEDSSASTSAAIPRAAVTDVAPTVAEADSPMATEHALQPPAGLPQPSSLPQDDAAGQRWLQARQALVLAQRHAAANRELLRSRTAWLDLQTQRERLAGQEQLDRDLDALHKLIRRMIEAGVLGSTAETRLQLAMAESRAQMALLRRENSAATSAWQPWAVQAELVGEMPAIEPRLLPESVNTAVDMARQWHPGLQLRRAEQGLAQAWQALSASGQVECQRGIDGWDALSLLPRCGERPERSEHTLRQSEQAAQQAERDAADIAAEYWRDYRQLSDAVSALEAAVASSGELFELLTRQFDIGQRTPSELLQAMRSRLELGDRLLRRRQARDIAALQLLLATGQLPQLAPLANGN